MPGATQQIVAVAFDAAQQRDAAYRVIQAAHDRLRTGDVYGARLALSTAVMAMKVAGLSTPPIQPTAELSLVPKEHDETVDVVCLAPKAVRP
jgi:hypothetical protein